MGGPAGRRRTMLSRDDVVAAVEGSARTTHIGGARGGGAAGAPLPAAPRPLPCPRAARAVNFVGLAALALVFALVLRGDRRADEPIAATIALALTLANAPLVAWAFGGLEGPLLAALVAAGVAATQAQFRDGPQARLAAAGGLAFGLAVLTRPDAGLFLGCVPGAPAPATS